MNSEETAAYIHNMTERCRKASLTDEQTARVIAFALDNWAGGEKEAITVIAFFEAENQHAFDREYEALTAPSGLALR